MPCMNVETHKTVIALRRQDYDFESIRNCLSELQLQEIYRNWKKVQGARKCCGSAAKKAAQKVVTRNVDIYKWKLEEDEITFRLRNMLLERWPELSVSLDTIKHCRRKLNWVCTRSRYCQLVRHLIRRKRLFWCKEVLKRKENLIFSDECTMQLEQYTR